jgi:hypothetical protein
MTREKRFSNGQIALYLTASTLFAMCLATLAYGIAAHALNNLIP